MLGVTGGANPTGSLPGSNQSLVNTHNPSQPDVHSIVLSALTREWPLTMELPFKLQWVSDAIIEQQQPPPTKNKLFVHLL